MGGWVQTFGKDVVNSANFAKQDLKVKRAVYITKNKELNQEFYFSHPETKFEVNKIFNTNYTGSLLWNLFSDEAVKLESSYKENLRSSFPSRC